MKTEPITARSFYESVPAPARAFAIGGLVPRTPTPRTPTPRVLTPRTLTPRALAVGALAPAIFALVALAFAPLALAAEDGRSIMERVKNQAETWKTETADIELLIFDENDKRRERYFRLKRKIKAEETLSLMKFYRPVKVKGTGVLTEAARIGDDAPLQWVWFPALRSIKQLSSSERNDSFFGSDFSFADIAGRTLDQDVHELVRTSDKHWFVRSVPKSSEDPYSKLEVVVEREREIVLQIVFYNRANERLKTLRNKTAREIKQAWYITESEMVNHLRKSRSVVKKTNIEPAVDIADGDVSITALRVN